MDKLSFLDAELVFPTGSRYICSPPVTDTDEDYLVYTNDLGTTWNSLVLQGYTTTTEPFYEGLDKSFFTSWRKEDVNVILISDKTKYDRFVLATKVAKKLNLLKKEDRITLFHAVLYNEFTD